MRKKIIAFLLIWIILFQGVAYAEFDYAKLKKSIDDNFVLHENKESSSAFISPDYFTIQERSFEHEGESEGYYSYFENDWLILDYDQAAQPRRRLWIYFSSKEAQDITAVSFSFAGNIYTFSNIFHPMVDVTQYDNGEYCQRILLIFGSNSRCFLEDLLDYVCQLEDVTYDAVMNMPPIHMQLHGKKEYDVEMPNSFLIDCTLTDMLISDYDEYCEAIGMVSSPTTFKVTTEQEARESNILPLGNNGEFAIQTTGSYTYNTPQSDLTGYETTDKWMFENESNVTCIVHSYNHSAYISYYPTDSNSSLSSLKLMERCIETTFGDKSRIFDRSFTYKRDGAYISINSIDTVGSSKVYYEYSYVVLENGIVSITSNSSDESVSAFVSEIADSIMVKDSNGFVSDYD